MLQVEGFLTAVRDMINAGHRLAQEREGIPTPRGGAEPTLAISAKNCTGSYRGSGDSGGWRFERGCPWANAWRWADWIWGLLLPDERRMEQRTLFDCKPPIGPCI